MVFMVLTLLCSGASFIQAEEVFLDEQFTALTRWQPFYFPKIESHSSYRVLSKDGVSCLEATSNNSASAILLKEPFNVYTFSTLAWRWKVSNVYTKGDSSSKDGDDYPLRLYVMFAYAPEKASFGEKIQYGIAKLLYGTYPPHSSLNYIWANKKETAPFIPNPYTSLAMMIPVASGQEKVGTWQEHRVDIVRDYRVAFGEDPPAVASLAVMSDSDNTGESATAYIDYIRLYKE
ncbi:MAG: DUF3047 domain-containing protein [Proteobacteria bacterium]|nr:DUF3047 domain-containing protein [Pseudomonadota bacterium]MBU1058397.1 DUF3047 domain-containing protein [Pseudomonadota bacterium]